ncbi:hypothetical protein RA27_02230 [Ruegeria sp. ANG-R]|uniref:hypothetical protein n=1 Tax=Ruegeria sp. ANG-R TaxID=1577903 RepID=UPI00057FF307|nr:hypothetical protein [Ruegeria sp. ANG-R]KIC42229.1 hypothetical protein RA27_02230 [Ruegeria sp. ANG-R]
MEPAHHQEQEYRLVSQAEFAREMDVSRAAVSQWKSNDILRDDAFTKPGKKGKLKFEIAVDQVRRNRDLGQSLGNGIATRTTVDQPAQPTPPQPAAPAPPASDQPDLLSAPQPQTVTPEPQPAPAAEQISKPDTVEDQLKRARLEDQLRKNRISAAEEAERQGLLMGSEDAREQMMRIAGMMMQIFEGALTDFATVVASEFGVPKRDVLHLLKAEFRNVRETAMRKERARQNEVERNAVASVDMEA